MSRFIRYYFGKIIPILEPGRKMYGVALPSDSDEESDGVKLQQKCLNEMTSKNIICNSKQLLQKVLV
jgi:hypothetical protein